MLNNRKGTTIRINESAREILEKINNITEIPKGKIILESLIMFNNKLIKEDYNYSKIIQK